MENNNIGNAERAGKNVPFERIRRITGYLVGTMDRWNDAKKEELHDRVKHCLLYTSSGGTGGEKGGAVLLHPGQREITELSCRPPIRPAHPGSLP